MTGNPQRKQPLSTTDSHVDEEAIRIRAYDLYIDRGMEDGHEVEDWLRAERELTSRKSQSAAA